MLVDEDSKDRSGRKQFSGNFTCGLCMCKYAESIICKVNIYSPHLHNAQLFNHIALARNLIICFIRNITINVQSNVTIR